MTHKAIRFQLGSLVAILLLAAFLRTLTLTSVELWRDELWTVDKSRTDVTAELNQTLHLILVAPLTRTLPDTLGVRILSYWLGLIGVAAAARLGFRLGGTKAAIVSAFLAAISPYLIVYSQEGRAYILCAVLVCLGVTAWLERRIVLSTILLLGGLLALGSAILVVVGLDVVLAIQYLRNRTAKPRIPVRQWAFAHALLYATAILFNILIKLSPAGIYQPTIRTQPVGSFLVRLAGMATCGEGIVLPCLSITFVVWPLIGLLLILVLRGTRPRPNMALMVGAIFVPVGISALLHAANYGIFVQKHLIWTVPLLLGLIATSAVARQRIGVILVVCVIVQAALALPLYYQANPYKPNWRQIVAYVEANRAPDEPVYTGHILHEIDNLTDEASYHFGRPIPAVDLPAAAASYWYISVYPEAGLAACQPVTGAAIRSVYLFHCGG